MEENRLGFGNWFKLFLRTALTVGLLVGLFESLVIAAKAISSNSLAIGLLAQLVVFVNVATALFLLFMLASNLVLLPLLFVPLRKISATIARIKPQNLAWFLNSFWAIGFTLIYWVNYNSGRSILAPKSIAFNVAAGVGAVVLAAIVARLAPAASMSMTRNGKPKPVVIGWLAVLLLAVFLLPNMDAATRSDRPNVVLLIIDTLRADRLGCYGYDKPTTPAIDEVAEESVLFEQAYVQWASSLPSHASIMASMHPYYHGAFPNGKSLNPKLLTLPKILKEYGYTNGAFVSNALVGNQYNFELGYNTFTDLTHFDYRDTSWRMWLHELNLIRLYDKLANRDLFTELAVSWIEHHQNRPFFLWGQWLHPHAPYNPPEEVLRKFEDSYSGIADGSLQQIFDIRQGNVELSEVDQRHYSALYDAEVAVSDMQIQRIYDRLKSLGLVENSIIIITSDHGENMLEHGLEYGHAGVHESSVRIPLIFRLPDRTAEQVRIPQVVQSIDIAPTVLDLIDVPAPEQFQGRSMMPLLEGDGVDWPNEAYCVGFWKKRNFFGLRKGDWKLILDARKDNHTWELYHLPTDPHETNNLYEIETEVAQEMKQAMEGWLTRELGDLDMAYQPGGFFEENFDQKTIERLRSLGYIK